MLVDDRPDLHVFMLRRNPRSVFGPGAFVFPGGAIDPADSDDELTKRVIGLDDRPGERPARPGSGGLRVWIGALREAFEEAGILLLPRPPARRRHRDRRRRGTARLNAGELRLADVLAEHRLVLDAGDVHLFSHWLTPEGAGATTPGSSSPRAARAGGQSRRRRARALRMGAALATRSLGTRPAISS